MPKDYSELLLDLVAETKELHRATLRNDLLAAAQSAHRCGKLSHALEMCLLKLGE
jgi:hypothetical protein